MVFSKKFLMSRVCEQLPIELFEKIWNYVEEDAWSVISRIYFYKCIINLDFLIFIMNFPKRFNPSRHKLYNPDNVSNFLNYYSDKINYYYIQDQEIWIEYLEKMQIYFIYYKNVNDRINYIINKIDYVE